MRTTWAAIEVRNTLDPYPRRSVHTRPRQRVAWPGGNATSRTRPARSRSDFQHDPDPKPTRLPGPKRSWPPRPRFAAAAGYPPATREQGGPHQKRGSAHLTTPLTRVSTGRPIRPLMPSRAPMSLESRQADEAQWLDPLRPAERRSGLTNLLKKGFSPPSRETPPRYQSHRLACIGLGHLIGMRPYKATAESAGH